MHLSCIHRSTPCKYRKMMRNPPISSSLTLYLSLARHIMHVYTLQTFTPETFFSASHRSCSHKSLHHQWERLQQQKEWEGKKLIEEVFSVLFFSIAKSLSGTQWSELSWIIIKKTRSRTELFSSSRPYFLRCIQPHNTNSNNNIIEDSWAASSGRCDPMRCGEVKAMWEVREKEEDSLSQLGGEGGGVGAQERRNETKPKIGLSFPSHISHCESYNA